MERHSDPSEAISKGKHTHRMWRTMGGSCQNGEDFSNKHSRHQRRADPLSLRESRHQTNQQTMGVWPPAGKKLKTTIQTWSNPPPRQVGSALTDESLYTQPLHEKANVETNSETEPQGWKNSDVPKSGAGSPAKHCSFFPVLREREKRERKFNNTTFRVSL